MTCHFKKLMFSQPILEDDFITCPKKPPLTVTHEELLEAGATRPTWRERQIIWERIRFIFEADKKSIGRDYHVGNMLDAYRKWESNFFGGCEKEGA